MTVDLIIIDGNLCSDTLRIVEPFNDFENIINLDIANVFTPNNDGINDFFGIKGDFSIPECTELRVYNRWGALLFESSGYNDTWDGRTFSGVEVPEGTYFYIITLKNREVKGSVTLIRGK